MKKIKWIVLIFAIASVLASCKSSSEKEAEELASYISSKGITTTPNSSGLYYIETKAGTGELPQKGQVVEVHYEGRLLDGSTFDSSYSRGEPFAFHLGQGQVIKGWDEGIALMKKGGKAQLIIPSHLGYGARGSGSIPGYSTLIFDVELIDIR